MLMRMAVQIEPGFASAKGHGADTRSRRNGDVVCALAVGGLDPGGGAGLLADLRAFDRAGVFGCAAVALTTVQSIAGLRAVHVEPAPRLAAEVGEVLEYQRIRAIKIGALGSLANVRALSRLLLAHRNIPVVVDTPMLPTHGQGRLLDPRALPEVLRSLVPLASLLTVNVDEAQAFLGRDVRTLNHARDAARALSGRGARAVLVKGGHLRGRLATDVLLLDGAAIDIGAPRLGGGPVHGTGCTLASLVAGRLARVLDEGLPDDRVLVSAVRWAKRVHHAALARAVRVGRGMRVMIP